jgi:hypothetical protein
MAESSLDEHACHRLGSRALDLEVQGFRSSSAVGCRLRSCACSRSMCAQHALAIRAATAATSGGASHRQLGCCSAWCDLEMQTSCTWQGRGEVHVKWGTATVAAADGPVIRCLCCPHPSALI